MPKLSESAGLVILAVGIVLLIITFVDAYLLLWGLGEIVVMDLSSLFGEALAPLITATIRAIYLGIMGWIGSIMTVRGIQILASPTLKGKEATSSSKKETEEEKD